MRKNLGINDIKRKILHYKRKMDEKVQLWKKIHKSGILISVFLILVFPLAFVILLHIGGIPALRDVIYDVDFWYYYMTFFGTVVVAGVSLYQSQKVNKLSIKFDEINALQNYGFAKIRSEITILGKENNGRTVIISAEHKDDSNSVILISSHGSNKEADYEEYYFELFFDDFSKSPITEFLLETSQICCVQESSEDGMILGDISEHNPIPVAFREYPSNNNFAKAYPKWTSKGVFKVTLKIYTEKAGIFDNIVQNKVPFTFMFPAVLKSISGVNTKIIYKIWVDKKGSGLYEGSNVETIIREIKIDI